MATILLHSFCASEVKFCLDIFIFNKYEKKNSHRQKVRYEMVGGWEFRRRIKKQEISAGANNRNKLPSSLPGV